MSRDVNLFYKSPKAQADQMQTGAYSALELVSAMMLTMGRKEEKTE